MCNEHIIQFRLWQNDQSNPNYFTNKNNQDKKPSSEQKNDLAEFNRISYKRHLNLNKLMREVFCSKRDIGNKK